MSETKVTYHDLVDTISDKTGQTKQLTDDFLKETVAVINEGLERDGKVRVSRFGIFELRHMAEREGVNPQTGESIVIPEHTRVAFKASASLRRAVNRRYLHLAPKFLQQRRRQRQDVVVAEGISYQGRERNRKWLWGILALVFLAVLAFLFFPDKSKNISQIPFIAENDKQTQPEVERDSEPGGEEAVPMQTRDEMAQRDQQTELENAQERMQPPQTSGQDHTIWNYPEGGIHQIDQGDNLWYLADRFYRNSYYWPNIFRVNTDRLDNPNLLLVGINVEVPEFEGTPGNLSRKDSADISLGYLEAYNSYKRQGNSRAPYYLLVSKRYSSDTLNEHQNKIDAEDLAFVKNFE